MSAANLFRVSVYVDGPDETTAARRILDAVRPESVQASPGVVSGLADEAAARALTDAGLLVAVAPMQPGPPAPGEAGTEMLLDAEASPSGAMKSAVSGEDERGSLLLARVMDHVSLPSEAVAGEARPGMVRAALSRVGTRLAQSLVAPPAGLGALAGPGSAMFRLLSRAGRGDVYEVRIDRRMDDELRETFRSLGLTLVSHRPPDTYRFYLEPARVSAVRALPFVRSVEAYGVEATVDDRVVVLADSVLQAGEPGGEPTETFDLVVHRPADLAAVRAAVQAQPGAEVVDESDAALRFRAPVRPHFLLGLASRTEVARLEVYVPPRLFCDVARGVIGVDALAPPPPPAVEWDGGGETVAVFDSGVDATHRDFGDRLVRRKWGQGTEDDLTGHGTHVAGIIAGDGTLSGGRVRGVAPGARLLSVGITRGASLDLPLDLGTLLSMAVEHGADIVNLSWGQATDTAVAGLNGARRQSARYEQMARSVDQFVYDNPGVLVVVAAGNAGAAPDGTPALYRVYTPGTAKNVVTVGASLNGRPEFAARTWGRWSKEFADPEGSLPMAGDPGRVASLSSTGPTHTEMVKPDVVAPGTFILSARAGVQKIAVQWEPCPDHRDEAGREWYFYTGGTSMAAPAVSGAAAVLRQYLRTAAGHPRPSAALLKAALVASATRLAARRADPQKSEIGFPDFDQGFGRVDLRNVLPHPGAPAGRRLLFADVANGGPEGLVSGPGEGSGNREMRVYTVRVPAGAASPLVIVLTWTDKPDAGPQSILQMAVRRPDGAVQMANDAHVFKRNPLAVPPEAEWRNTVKAVRVDPAPPGTYRIRVIAENTTAGPSQGYALVVCGEVDEEQLK